MEQTEGLSYRISKSLYAGVMVKRIAANQSLSEYVTGLLTNYYENGGKKGVTQTRTMAFQINEDLFRRIEDYLAHEDERQGRKVTQEEFVIGLIEDILERWEQETTDTDPSAPADALDSTDGPTGNTPSWGAKETEGGAKNVAG